MGINSLLIGFLQVLLKRLPMLYCTNCSTALYCTHKSYCMEDMAILETFVQLIEQNVVNSKKAEKSELE